MTTMDNQALQFDPALVRRGRRNIILLALLFALPVIVAFVLIKSGWRPSETVNYGELVNPPTPIADVTLLGKDGAPVPLSALRRDWVLITFAAPRCAAACQQNLYKMRQVHLAQGKNQERVQRVVVVSGALSEAPWEPVSADTGLRVLTGTDADVAGLRRQFVAAPATPGIYIMDPMGNLVLRYTADADPTGIRKDLGRLLRGSQVG